MPLWPSAFTVLVACNGGTPQPSDALADPPATQEQPVDFLAKAEQQAARQALLARLPDASAVFVGTLVEVGEPPGFWSGYKIASQALTYDVTEVLGGDVQPGRITVYQWIVNGSPTAEKDEPKLRSEYTQTGTSYLVALGPVREGKQMTFGEGFGPTPADEALLEAARDALKPR